MPAPPNSTVRCPPPAIGSASDSCMRWLGSYLSPGGANQETLSGHSAFRIEAGAAKILIDPFLSDNPSRDNGWSGYLTGKNSTQGGDR
jgi:hypothetical protein